MISALNHLTLAVSDLERSIDFYNGLLGLKMRARWNTGAYLSAGELWLCLSAGLVANSGDYTHYAFTVSSEEFPNWSAKLDSHQIERWQTNRSEGDSIYFLDPDGHRLELHAGDLETRLASLQTAPYDGLQLF